MTHRKVIAYVVGAFVLFLGGYLITYGREAAASGSWNIVITHDDESIYWAVAKGASQTPMSDEDPYHYEEMGKRMSLPWTTAILIGKLSKFLGVSVMTFFPFWHIGMPFLMWLSMFLCLWKIWRKPPGPSAALAMILLLSTLFFRGQIKNLLFRFARPGDGLWLLFFWVSLAMNPEVKFKMRKFLLCLIAFIVFWLQPYYALLGATASIFEMSRSFLRKEKENFKTHSLTLLSLLLACATYFYYFQMHSGFSSRLIQSALSATTSYMMQEQIPFVSWGLIILSCFFIFLPSLASKRPLTSLERLAFYGVFSELLTANLLAPLIKVPMEAFTHRYYLFLIQTACLAGIMIENGPVLFSHPFFRRWEKFFVVAAVICFGCLLANSRTYFLIHVPKFIGMANINMSYLDNAILLTVVFLIIFVGVWVHLRFSWVRKLFCSPKWVITFIVVLGLSGYFTVPSYHRPLNQNYPFEGAFQWFREHAKKYEVVLTLPPKYISHDYLVLRTDLKSYYVRQFNDKNVSVTEDMTYRKIFYQALAIGWLKELPLGPYRTLEEKLKRLKLNYILIDKPSPFLETVQGQLGAFLTKVYEDRRAIIWRVHV